VVQALPQLSFPVEALEPNIDKETMTIHHGKHHAGYVRKLNAAVKDNNFTQMPLLDILSTVTENDTAVRNNGGGHFNHSLFWNIISPNAGGVPEGSLADAIKATFGSFDEFKDKFSTAAKTRFGSGWAWLSVDTAGKLFVSSTPNQDNPLMTNLVEQNGTPILGIDVWEHAYYLHYQNMRGDYVQNFFNVINWKAVTDNYAKIVG
jgi:Fe-Mn family superoxide dismutase